ncbi:MAG TPA: acetate--CoA ligase [Baekduia sp.]|nr:acetate--CoA ligase [Baekduia sp.]
MLLRPNMPSYDEARAAFSWAAARAELDGLPGGGLNIAHEALDRHADGPRAEHVALRWLGRDGDRRELTYAQLRDFAARFAGVLGGLGVQRGDRVFALCPRIPELYAAGLGTLRHGAVFCPLFSAFGPEPVRQRLARGGGSVLVTTRALHDRKVAPVADQLPDLRHVLLVDEDLPGRLAAAAPGPMAAMADDDPALLHFTSGTTGAPKGAVHAHRAVVAHRATARMVLDLHDDDVYWCTADPGWVTGTSYGMIAPLACGVTMVVDEAELDADRWYATLEREAVSVWYTAPTAIRMLMRAGEEPLQGRDLSALRLAFSVGEPLAADAVRWGERMLGRPFHDTWWQTETGAIMVANVPAEPPRAGSMGRPVPGVEAAVARRSADGEVVRRPDGGPELIEEPGVDGELVLRAGWPSMFTGYLGDDERYRRSFAGGWYLSGDLVRRDAEGFLWFVGRGDDVIKTAGHLVGPFEIESALVEHPAVAEAAAIGIPDPVAGEVVHAKVVLARGHEESPALLRELRGFARTRLGPAIAPRRIDVVDDIPYTKSGKKLRRLLRARELGLPEGDLSTLETAR